MKAIAAVLSLLLATAYGCNQRITDPSGVVTSPNHPADYPPDADCTTDIIAPEGKFIYLEFEAFKTEGTATGRCFFDYLEVYDGHLLYGQYCGREIPRPILTSGNTMKLRFRSDASLQYEGYRATFRVVDEGAPIPTDGPGTCGGQFQGDSGSITSPNYPRDYEPNHDCTYMLTLNSTGQMILDFDDFELEGGTGCRWDYVEVRDGGPTAIVLGKFCGTSANRVKASGNKLHVKFVTDGSTQRRGFKASWQKASCAMFGGTCNATCSNGELNYDCQSGLKCCKPDIFPKDCGKPAIAPTERFIVGGEEATPNSWPWQASLRTGNFHYCGASLITNQWVMTAAHCVDTKSSTDVVLGEHNRDAISGNEKKIRGGLIIAHEGFRSGAPFPNDIALIKLDELVAFDDTKSPPCLPSDENQEFLPEDGCYITGWGNTQGPQNRNVLQQLQIDPITNEECKELWGASYILDSHVCLGRGMVGACNGDSGGPFVCKKGDEWVLAGATSWGIRGCKTEGYPSVYTRVSKFLDWMTLNIQNNQ